jgi:hypothetical protein
MDTDGQHTLNFEEFRNGVRKCGVVLENKEVRQLFDTIDKDHSGEIDYEEFLAALRVSRKFAPMINHIILLIVFFSIAAVILKAIYVEVESLTRNLHKNLQLL